MRYLLLIITAIFFYACASTDYTNRSQLMLLSDKEEMALGEQSAKEILQNAKISRNAIQTKMVERVGVRIANVANRPDFKWEFHLLQGEQINAFCLPGGKVFVYTGLMDLVANDDELAVVLSHEIAHTILRHGAERMSMQNIRQIGGSLLGLIVQSQAPEYTSLFNQAYSVGSNVGVMLPFSRSHELEADKVGIALMQKAGYNTQAAITFWQKMATDEKDSSDFLSTHPSDTKRIQAIQEILK
ncbi:M48 family metallopeptidase [Helicobacter turcicus]|uniref:M48 family metallopeptidase n=1 Tax=Helicobacter turcicus TaxID=2867412 RepID=A0ABS7JKF5_9HELI|nr:M48 family metallopeptidase [Helicobacter turcicus]MBX7489870.1 M48 family metallopeptidase [Helicobacter turcicus]MBX7544730.1 M48 family metallopeptidase [Helicobacter turcicus]